MTVHRCEAGDLELGAGLEVLVAATLEGVPVSGELDVVSESRSATHELVAWARLAGHHVVDEWVEAGTPRPAFILRIRRGSHTRVLGSGAPAGEPVHLEDGAFPTSALRAATDRAPAHADPTGGLIPLGALVEPGGPGHRWRLSDRDRIWANEVAALTDRGARSQWDATRDVPWEAAQGLPADVERAVAQVMTYIAQNEYAAYYVPARYLTQVNPQYVEVLMWLASHVHDEARHIEVFTKRALVGGVRAHALTSTELSLSTLLEEQDFSAAALLLNVLGEGTFLDLLRFVADHAPDAATATAAGLAHRDELRHVAFGTAHVRHRLTTDPDQRELLIAAVEARAAKLSGLTGLSPLVGEALVWMASPSRQPADLSEAGRAVRDMMERLQRSRVRHLRAAGFDDRTARHLSDLHTPNLM